LRGFAIGSSLRITREKPVTFLAIESLLSEKGYLKSADIQMILGVSRRHAIRIANSFVEKGWLTVSGEGRQKQYNPT
jgi:CRP-like cAMP-binding protein